MTLIIPSSLTIEHEALHQRLVAATQLSGATGNAAREVARRLHPHFEKEESYALPPLGLLAALARDEVTPAMTEVLPLSRRLESELAAMLAEHRDIVAALDVLKEAAEREQHAEVVAFTEALKAHAETEEQVMYPAAILVGRYVAQALEAKGGREAATS